MTTKWNGWFGLGGQIKGAPAAVAPTADTIDIYVRGMDDRLWQKWWDGSKWHPSDDGWTVHDDGAFRLGSSPSVISRGAGFRDVYVRGQDGAVYHKFWDGSKWNGWFGLGGSIKGAPSAVGPTPDTIDIYAKGTDDRLWQKWWDGSKWGPSDSQWHPHDDGMILGSSPSVLAEGAGFRDLYARHPNGTVIHKFWKNGTWSQWFGLGGSITGAPLALSVVPGFHEIYARGTDGRLWQKAWDGKAWIPSDMGWTMNHDGNLRIGEAPGGYAFGANYRDIYAPLAGDGSVLHKYWNNASHSAPLTIRADSTKSAAIDKIADLLVGANQPGVAIAVVKSGQIVHLAGRGVTKAGGAPITSETMFHLASCGKQFTGLGIAMLDEDPSKDFSVADPLSKHLPELKGYGSKVTIERLLHHVSDILDMYGTEGANAVAAQSGAPTNAHVLKAIVALGCKMDPNPAQPGTDYKYSNTEYDLLGSVIERVSGQSYQEFFRTRVFRPMGMTDSFSLPDTSRLGDFNTAVGHDKVGGTKITALPPHWMDGIVGAGSFYCSVFDLVAYDVGLAGNLLVSSASKAKMHSNFTATASGPTNYGYGWILGSFKGDFVEHDGAWNGFSSHIRRYLDNQLSVFVLSNRSDLNPAQFV
ncbi:MAG TPA: serine hydrolase, partial [Allosphingosinicella sp.]